MSKPLSMHNNSENRGLFYWQALTLIMAWRIYYIHSKVREEIIYPPQNFNGTAAKLNNG